MNDNIDLNKIKDRITKLLRMAADSSSPNEAAIAASRARKLMDKYQIDLAQIDTEFKEAFSTAPVGRFYAAFPAHMSIFAVHVAKYNDCQCVMERGEVTHRMAAKKKYYEGKPGTINNNGVRPVFRGYKSDVELAVQMYDSLLEAVDRLRREYIAGKGYAKHPVGVARAFNLAAIDVIGNRISAMTAEREMLTVSTIADACTSLVLFKSAAVDEAFGSIKYKTMKMKHLSDENAVDARIAGVKAGNKIEITRQID